MNSRLDRRLPSRYTASYSLRRSRRQSRGRPREAPSNACEAVPSLFTACCKNFYSAFRFHAGAKTVLFVPAALMWLIRSLGQRNFSCFSLFRLLVELRAMCQLVSVLRGRQRII